MRQTNIYAYYAFGFNYGLLKMMRFKGASKSLVIRRINLLFREIDDLKIPVTKLVAKPLEEMRDNLKASEDDKIDDNAALQLKDILEKIDATLDAELKLKNIYQLTEKRFELNKLLKDPGSLLSTTAFEALPSSTARDFRLACRQIAYGMATSSAFHMMRAVEAEVKRLYFAYKKTKRLAQPMWAAMIQQLRVKRNPKPTDKLLDHLDSMRKHFRNPTQHPDVFYSIDEAQDLLNQTIVAMNMIFSELPD